MPWTAVFRLTIKWQEDNHPGGNYSFQYSEAKKKDKHRDWMAVQEIDWRVLLLKSANEKVRGSCWTRLHNQKWFLNLLYYTIFNEWRITLALPVLCLNFSPLDDSQIFPQTATFWLINLSVLHLHNQTKQSLGIFCVNDGLGVLAAVKAFYSWVACTTLAAFVDFHN